MALATGVRSHIPLTLNLRRKTYSRFLSRSGIHPRPPERQPALQPCIRATSTNHAITKLDANPHLHGPHQRARRARGHNLIATASLPRTLQRARLLVEGLNPADIPRRRRRSASPALRHQDHDALHLTCDRVHGWPLASHLPRPLQRLLRENPHHIRAYIQPQRRCRAGSD